MTISKEQAVTTAIKEGKVYKEKLSNTIILIIYRDRVDNILKHLEIEFRPHNYQHLTGLLLSHRDSKTGELIVREHTAMEFYRRCTDIQYITPDEIVFNDEGTIDLKMAALPYITQITRITRMTGSYDNRTKIKLSADYIVGGVNSCIGVSKNSDNDRYYPCSCLSENIMNITKYTSQVLTIFQKEISSKDVYKDIKYVAKGLNLNKLIFPEYIREMISLEKYIAKSGTPR